MRFYLTVTTMILIVVGCAEPPPTPPNSTSGSSLSSDDGGSDTKAATKTTSTASVYQPKSGAPVGSTTTREAVGHCNDSGFYYSRAQVKCDQSKPLVKNLVCSETAVFARDELKNKTDQDRIKKLITDLGEPFFYDQCVQDTGRWYIHLVNEALREVRICVNVDAGACGK